MYNLHKDTPSVYVPLELFGQSSAANRISSGQSKIAKIRCAVALEWCQYRLEGVVFSMPKGDAQRVWFPEMLARLRREWRETMSFAALVDLRDSLDSSPVFTCPKCGLRGPMAEPQVSVRAMILAARRFGIALPAKTKALEREWSRYRDQQGLDLYGKSLVFENPARETNECRCEPGATTLP
jgi:hypothetical protein